MQPSCNDRLTHTQILAGEALISCPLLALPTEVLLCVFEQADPIDAVCLALASKRLLQVSSLLTISVPSVAKHRNIQPSTCKDIYHLLWRFEPLCDRRVYNREKKFGLCCDCLQYRPKKKVHWRLFAAKYKRTRGVSGEQWKEAVKQWSGPGAQCPECYCDEHYAVIDK